jgi:hypothetical protein
MRVCHTQTANTELKNFRYNLYIYILEYRKKVKVKLAQFLCIFCSLFFFLPFLRQDFFIKPRQAGEWVFIFTRQD